MELLLDQEVKGEQGERMLLCPVCRSKNVDICYATVYPVEVSIAFVCDKEHYFHIRLESDEVVTVAFTTVDKEDKDA